MDRELFSLSWKASVIGWPTQIGIFISPYKKKLAGYHV